MTEAEWLACDDPLRALAVLRACLEPHGVRRLLRPFGGHRLRRKLRLYTGQVLYPYYPWLHICTDADRQNILDDIDRWADNRSTELVGEADSFFSVLAEMTGGQFPVWRSSWTDVNRVTGGCLDPAVQENGRRECDLLRDIFGYPFRPVAFSPKWRTDTAVALARQMYDARDFSAMPILADALQDASCDNADILNHCRSDGPHVRGCWVVDLVLGKAE